MESKDVLATLKKQGTAQNRKIYARHGYPEDSFGVSFANLRALAKKLGTNQALAQELWDTGNGDAQLLAVMVADPEAMTAATLERWMKGVRFYVLAGMFSGLVARSQHARKKCEQWMASTSDFTAQAGWNLCAMLVAPEHNVSDAWFQERLDHIEQNVHDAPNRARHAMGMALCSIGGHRPALRAAAVAAARRIGPIEVDHGETGCKTPDAVSYIAKIAAHQAGKTTRKAPAKKPGGRATAKR